MGHRLPIRLLLSLLGSALIWGGTPHQAPAAAGSAPNIVLIYADDVGYGDIGAYGATGIRTPHIDRLAEEGLRLTHGYATAATCTPSRYSLLTGSYAFRHDRARVLSAEAPLLIDPESLTLPSVLQEAGYSTACIGKWHLGLGKGTIDWNGVIRPGPLDVGFDESFIIPATNDRVPCVFVKGDRVYRLADDDPPLRVSYQQKVGDLPTGRSHPERLRYPADDQHSGTIVNRISRIGWMAGGQSAWWRDEEMAAIFTRRSQAFIEDHRDDPFFLYLALHENHVPRVPHPDFIYTSETGLRGDVIHELDWVVGEIIKTLERLELREETLVIFTSDNGPIFDDGYRDSSIKFAQDHDPSGPLRGGKYQTFEGGTRVPFIVSWPGHVKPGVSDALISQVDLFASLAALADREPPPDAAPDSKNLLPALLGQSRQGRKQLIQQGVGTLAIRSGPWKYIPAFDPPDWSHRKHAARPNPLTSEKLPQEPHLFNLNDDPGETTNLAPQFPERAQQLAARLKAIRSSPQDGSVGTK